MTPGYPPCYPNFMIPIVSIVGRSGSGKTTLLEKVVAELKKRGYRVGTIKHDAHGFEIDYEGKDSWRHKRAGARAVVLSSPKRIALIKDVEKEPSLDRIRFEFMPHDLDIVISEGYKKAKNSKIEVVRKAVSSKPLCIGDENLLAIVSDVKLKKGNLPWFDISDYKGISTFIENRFLKRAGKDRLNLLVNGRTVELKPFIENLLVDAVKGMVGSLKGCKRPEEIEIRIKG